MKTPITLAVIAILSIQGLFAQEIKRDLRSFRKIIASQHVNVVLTRGDKESIRLVYENVDASKINIEVYNRTLQIYLDGAKRVEHTINDGFGHRRGIYQGAHLTAYVTYRELDAIDIRGNQSLTCDKIQSENFKLKAYGENEISIASLDTDFFKAIMYGENNLTIGKGRIVEQKYKLYGENKIDTHEVQSAFATATIFGEGKVKVNSSEEVTVNAFGEPQLYVNGQAHINRRLVFGKMNVYRY